MPKVHINNDNRALRCKAEKRPCRFKKEFHFRSLQKATTVANKILDIAFDKWSGEEYQFDLPTNKDELKKWLDREYVVLQNSEPQPPLSYDLLSEIDSLSADIKKELGIVHYSKTPYGGLHIKMTNADGHELDVNEYKGSLKVVQWKNGDFTRTTTTPETFVETLEFLKQARKESNGDTSMDLETLLAEYTDDSYDINESVRRGTITPDRLDKFDKLMASDVLEEDTIVFRGAQLVGMSKEEKENLVDESYTSWSTSPQTALGFSYLEGTGYTNMYCYKIPKGTRCRIVGGTEGEIILPRGFDFSQAILIEEPR